MDKLVIVSADGHAAMPPALWPKYLDQKYHKYLDRLQLETQRFTGSMQILNDLSMPKKMQSVFDKENAYFSGQWNGLWNREIRLKEMDREGVAAEFVFSGDFRASDLFFSTMNGVYALEAVDAGVQAWNEWAHDEFGPAKERFLLIGPAGTFLKLDKTIKQADWMADHGFTGTFTPGYFSCSGQPPLFDPYYDRVWATYAERNLVMITHGGYGLEQGFAFSEIEAAAARVAKKGGGDMDLVQELATTVFTHDFFSDLRCRQSMFQLMLGGVFDRHPNLKMMMTEVRADWIPAALALLDQVWEKNRKSLPAKKRPSEYWRSNCMAGISFMHKAEADKRREIGVETIAFGRDYPHTEGTWPNTVNYLQSLFRGVPENEVRAMLGENVIKFLKLDRSKLTVIADRIGPSYEQIIGGAEIDPALTEHLGKRTGIFDAWEGEARVSEMAALVQADLPRIGALSAAL